MEGDRQHVVALVEARLRAVSVVHVPVDDGDAPRPRRPKAIGRESDVVEEAVAVHDRRTGVVTRGTDERVGDGALTGDEGIGGCQSRSGGCEDRGPGARRKHRRGGDMLPAGLAGAPDGRDVLGVVDGLEFVHPPPGGRPSSRSGPRAARAEAPRACSECAQRSPDAAPVRRGGPREEPPRGRRPCRARERRDARRRRGPSPERARSRGPEARRATGCDSRIRPRRRGRTTRRARGPPRRR